MAPRSDLRKRKASNGDAPVFSDGESDSEFGEGLLDAILSQSEDDSEDESLEDGESLDGEEEDALEELDTDEIPSEDEGDDKSAGRVVDLQGANGAFASDTVPTREEEEDNPNYTITTDANGGERYVYNEIEPGYDSDDSDAPITTNTIGNIPLTFYESYPHIGYDINGKRIMRPAKGEALDALLDSIDVPKGWTGLTDPATGKPLSLSQDELEVLRKIQMNEVPEDGYDPYPATIEYFTGIEEKMPLSAAPEPKRRFLPSKHEAKRVMKIVRAIREGRILPYRPPEEQEEDDEQIHYDIWQDEQPRPEHVMNIAAPKSAPPGYDMSYNPPPEYLPSKKEREAYEAEDPEDREKEYLPTAYDALRKVPAYDKTINERFERSLDLYLAPRVRKNRLNIDPNSLLPKLPRPEELRPFPTVCSTLFRGHEGRVRSLAIDPSGIWLASGGDDGTVRVWELLTGRQVWNVKIGDDDAVNVVRWRPGRDAVILAAAAGEDVFLMTPFVADPELETASRDIIDAGFGYATQAKPTLTANGGKKDPPATWSRPGSKLEDAGVLVKITLRTTVKVISWHRRGDFFSTVSPTAQRSAVAIHTLSKHLTQIPFRRLPGLPQSVQFHPLRPLFFVATQRTIRSYDLQKQELVKIIQPGARWISSFDIHPGGDNLIVGSYDRRLLWHDLDLSTRPYKTMRFHNKAIRAVKYHRGGLPLFADASDDGSLQIFHGKVVSDMMENATIVPVKVLKGHKVKNALGVMDVDWHPKEPWCINDETKLAAAPTTPVPKRYGERHRWYLARSPSASPEHPPAPPPSPCSGLAAALVAAVSPSVPLAAFAAPIEGQMPMADVAQLMSSVMRLGRSEGRKAVLRELGCNSVEEAKRGLKRKRFETDDAEGSEGRELVVVETGDNANEGETATTTSAVFGGDDPQIRPRWKRWVWKAGKWVLEKGANRLLDEGYNAAQGSTLAWLARGFG